MYNLPEYCNKNAAKDGAAATAAAAKTEHRLQYNHLIELLS